MDRTVFLFGAGAAIDWGGPTTDELTNLIRKTSFKISDNTTSITDFIYSKLVQENYFPEHDVNFETIINVIEELISYYSSFNTASKTPTVLQAFFNSKYEVDLLNFSIEGGVEKHGFRLEIPKGNKIDWGKMSLNNERPAQFFFQYLLSEILTAIVSRIAQYSFHSKAQSRVITTMNSEINLLFSKWMNAISSKSILRMYTLNYDKNFKIILENAIPRIEIFDGFDYKSELEYGSYLTPNVPRILNDFNTHVLYNLHGSSMWKVNARDSNLLANPSYVLSSIHEFEDNSHEPALWQTDRGKTLMLTNIITGYQKTQRGIFSPFRQMLSTFDRDSILANVIYIVGYSFNDEHINSSIKTAIQFNPKLKIVIIDPGFISNKIDEEVAIKIFTLAGKSNEMRATSINSKLHHYFGGKFIAHTKTFKDFLMKYNN